MALSKKQQLWLGAGLVIAAIAGFLIYDTMRANRAERESEQRIQELLEESVREEPATELEFTDITVGTGAEATSDKVVTVHYVGRLEDGTEFENSRSSGQPERLLLGAGKVIEGWDKGIPGMKVGGKRRLVVPPELAYGQRGLAPDIPPNATLIFEIELLSVEEPTA